MAVVAACCCLRDVCLRGMRSPAAATAANDVMAGSEHSDPGRWPSADGLFVVVVVGARYILVDVCRRFSLVVDGRWYILVVVIRITG